jgi:phage shock protein PspC (stress-responsive transcriptional regulator)
MYCSHCGKQLDPTARFCSSCGAAWTPAAPAPTPRRPLTRPRSPRAIAGVCAAFALEYGWDLSLVRVITALFIVFTGVGLLAYLAAWIIIPEEPYALPSNTTTPGNFA